MFNSKIVPVLKGTHNGSNIILYGDKYYGVPFHFGRWNPEDDRDLHHPLVPSCGDMAGLRALIDKVRCDESLKSYINPVFHEAYRGHNIVEYERVFYGIPRFVGRVDLKSEAGRNHFALTKSGSLDGARRMIDEADMSKFSVSTLPFEGYNILRGGNRYYAVPVTLSGRAPDESWLAAHPDVISADSPEELAAALGRAGTPPELVEEHRRCNIIRYQSRFFIIPLYAGRVDFKKDGGPLSPDVIEAESAEAAKKLIDLSHPEKRRCRPVYLDAYRVYDNGAFLTAKPGAPGLGFLTAVSLDGLERKVAERHAVPWHADTFLGHNIYEFRNAYYAAPSEWGAPDFSDPDVISGSAALRAPDLDGIHERIKRAGADIRRTDFAGVSVRVLNGAYYAVPDYLEPGDWEASPEKCPELIKASGLEGLAAALRSAEPRPALVERLCGFVIIRRGGFFYAVPRDIAPSLGFADGAADSHPAVMRDSSLSALRRRATASQCVTENFESLPLEKHNILRFMGEFVALPKVLGPVNVYDEKAMLSPVILRDRSLPALLERIKNSDLDYWIPAGLGDHNGYKLTGYMRMCFAVPLSAPELDIRDDGQRRDPRVLRADTPAALRRKIDALGAAVHVEYTGWLAPFEQFGNCGAHPQFEHLSSPPDGYVFESVASSWEDYLAMMRRVPEAASGQWVARAVSAAEAKIDKTLGSGSPAKISKKLIIPSLRVSLKLLRLALRNIDRGYERRISAFYGAAKFLPSILRYAAAAMRLGAKTGAVKEFIRTRDIRSQALLPEGKALYFLPSVPFTLGQAPWVMEIEDVTSIFFPFLENGATPDIDIRKERSWPLIKAILESPSCRGVITHMRSTYESLPKLFQSEIIRRKTFHQAYGVESPRREAVSSRKKDGVVRFLFTASWHQNPKSFYPRGGLDILEAYARLKKAHGQAVSMTFRCRLPQDMDSRFHDIVRETGVEVIDKFIPRHIFHELLESADVYLIPSLRIHVVSILQAMSYGKALITSDGWGIEEYVTNEKTGLVVKGRKGKVSWVGEDTGMLHENNAIMKKADPEYADRLFQAMDSLVRDPGLRLRLGQGAADEVASKFSLENWNKGLKVFFDRALANQPMQ